MKIKIPALLCISALFFFWHSHSAWASSDGLAAKKICALLSEQLHPERVVVTVKGSYVWTEIRGASLLGLRVERMRLRGKMKKYQAAKIKDDFTKLIESSQGEIVLKEEDLNNYLADAGEFSGFSGLRIDFRPEKSVARGLYHAKVLFKVKMRIMAKSRLSLEEDSLYLRDTEVFVEGVKQPQSMTEKITANINPLFSFSAIPFPVKFTKLVIDGESAAVTAAPNPVRGGETRSYTQKSSRTAANIIATSKN